MSRRKHHWSPHAMPAVRRLILEDGLSEAARFDQLLDQGLRPRGWSTEKIGNKRWEHAGAERLRLAELYWVRPNMAAAALDGSTDIPNFAPGVEKPSHAGVMGFERSLPPVVPAVPLGLEDGSSSSEPRPVDVLTWHTYDGTIMFRTFTRVENWGPGPRTGTAIPFERCAGFFVWTEGIVDLDLYPPTHRALLSFIGSTWVMMQTPTVAERQQLTPTGRSAERARAADIPSDVTLIDLRALRHETTTSAEERSEGRTYTHRWIVRGHWRNQAHGRERSERRLMWIPSYVKGPPEAPFKSTEKVMVWRR